MDYYHFISNCVHIRKYTITNQIFVIIFTIIIIIIIIIIK